MAFVMNSKVLNIKVSTIIFGHGTYMYISFWARSIQVDFNTRIELDMFFTFVVVVKDYHVLNTCSTLTTY